MNDTDVHNFAVQAGRPSVWPFITIAQKIACVIIGEAVDLISDIEDLNPSFQIVSVRYLPVNLAREHGMSINTIQFHSLYGSDRALAMKRPLGVSYKSAC